MISILSATLSNYDSSYGGYPFQISVRIQVAKREWHRLSKLNALGGLYNRDTSNALYQITKGKLPYCEVMLVKEERAKGESKEIELRYIFRDAEAAQALGMQGFTAKNGEFISKFGSYTDLLKRGAK